MKDKNTNQNQKNENDIEIVIGDESVLNISEVNDCMNSLRPKRTDKKKVIIHTNKKKKKQDSNLKEDKK